MKRSYNLKLTRNASPEQRREYFVKLAEAHRNDPQWQADRAARREKNIIAIRAKERARYRRWCAANPERKKEIANSYTARHRERLNAKQREKNKTAERKAFMREYAPKHRAENPELYVTYSENRRSRELGALGEHSKEEWIAKVAQYGHRCAYCESVGKMTRDHDIPLARGGSNNIENILPACGSCNSAKGTLTGDEYRQRLASGARRIDDRWAAQLSDARAVQRRSRQCLPTA